MASPSLRDLSPVEASRIEETLQRLGPQASCSAEDVVAAARSIAGFVVGDESVALPLLKKTRVAELLWDVVQKAFSEPQVSTPPGSDTRAAAAALTALVALMARTQSHRVYSPVYTKMPLLLLCIRCPATRQDACLHPPAHVR